MWGGGARYYWTGDVAAGEAKGIAVVFAWVWSEEAHVRPFVRLYAELGWRCLVCHADLVSLYFPEKAISLARGVINELLKELKVRPLPTILSTFSGGSKGCLYKFIKMLDGKCEQEATTDEYQLLRECICGQIYDSSPVDFINDMGTQCVHYPAVSNISEPPMLKSWMAKALASGLETIFPRRVEVQNTEYWQTLYSSLGIGPILILCSEDNDLARCHVIRSFAQRVTEFGGDVKLLKWSSSPHIGHYKFHPAEYRAAVTEHLNKAQRIFSQRSEPNDDKTSLNARSYRIAQSVCSLHEVAASSNDSLRRMANDPIDHFLLPSSKEFSESREPGSSIDERRDLDPRMEPQGVLGQILFDVCVPKNIEGWDIKSSISSQGRPALAAAQRLGPFNPIKYLRRSRL